MASKNSVNGPVKAPLGSYPKLWRLLDHYFLKEDVPDRTALLALDTIVELNESILSAPKSANNRAIRSSEPRVRNLVSMGGTDILTEIGWRFKVMRMEECWIFPYDADLDALRIQQDKIIETQQKLKERYNKSISATTGRAAKEKADKLAIMRQIEQDKAEREHRNALRAGAPPKPTQSLDEIRKQAVRERMERDKVRRSAATAAPSPNENQTSTTSSQLPGSFPTETNTLSGEPVAGSGEDEDDHSSDDSMLGAPRSRVGAPTGGRTPKASQTPRKIKRVAPVPIAVTKPVVKERYTATENRLGESSRELGSQEEGRASEQGDGNDDNDEDYDDEDDY